MIGMHITIKGKESMSDYLAIVLLTVASYSLIARICYNKEVLYIMDEIAEIIRNKQEQINAWIADPKNKTKKIESWPRYKKEKFDEVIRKLVISQAVGGIGSFEGGIGQIGDISYGLVKFRKPHLLKAWEEGIIVIYEDSKLSKMIGGKIGMLGFGINPHTKEVVGISFYDNTPSFVARHLEKSGGGFYFGSTEYTLPSEMYGGFNCFAVPVGSTYQKYYEIVKQAYRDYLMKITSV